MPPRQNRHCPLPDPARGPDAGAPPAAGASNAIRSRTGVGFRAVSGTIAPAPRLAAAARTGPLGAPALPGGGRSGPLRNGNRRGDPNAAPRCGARARTTGCPCRAPAMANGRCRMHGGRCTGPRTPEGKARMIAAKTTHGRYAVSGAPRRLGLVFGRTVVARILLASAAVRLWAYLPPAMAALGARGLLELGAPIHPSNLPFVKPSATRPNNVRRSAGRQGRAAGRGAADGGLALRGRQGERAAAAVEAAAQAPWRAAIAVARAARPAARDDATRDGSTQGGATQGQASGRASVTTQDVCINPLQREIAFRAAGLRASPPAPAAGPASAAARDSRNDPLQRGAAPRTAGLRVPAPMSPRHGGPALGQASRPPLPLPPGGASRDARNEALQPEPAAARRLMRPVPGTAAAPRVAPRGAPREPDVRAQLAARFGHAVPAGWHPPMASPAVTPVVSRVVSRVAWPLGGPVFG